MDNKITAFVNEQLKTELPKFEIGDTVEIQNRIKEGNKERIQLFTGLVIAKKNGGISETFTVRKVAYGVGVEKTFPIHSPNVVGVKVVRKGKFAARNSTMFVTKSAKTLRLKNLSKLFKQNETDLFRGLFCFLCAFGARSYKNVFWEVGETAGLPRGFICRRLLRNRRNNYPSEGLFPLRSIAFPCRQSLSSQALRST